jgi:hypothetical protein
MKAVVYNGSGGVSVKLFPTYPAPEVVGAATIALIRGGQHRH